MSEIEVVAQLRANADNMVSGFRRAGNAASGFQNQVAGTASVVQRGFSMMTRSIMLGAGMMQTAAMAGASMGVKFAMANEQAIISFKTLLGSQERAEKMFKDLQQFAATTPFEFPQLRDAASKLLTTGVEGKRVIPIMTALGDATAAMGTGAEGIQRAVYALQQMNLVGKITGQDMMQLANAGIPAWDALASAAGMSVQEVKKAVEKGTLQNSVQLLMTGIENYSGEAMGRVKGMMKEQSTTLVGLMSTLKDNVNIALGDMMKPAVGAIKDALPAINDAVGKTFKAMTIPINNMVTVFMDAFTKLIPAIEPMMMALSTIMVAAVEGIIPALAQMASVLPQMQPALVAIGQAFKDISTVVAPLIVQLVTGLAPVITTLVQSFAMLTGFVADNMGKIQALTPVIGGLVAAYVALKVATSVKNLFGNAKQVWGMVAAALGLGSAQATQATAAAAATSAQAALAVAQAQTLAATAPSVAASAALAAAETAQTAATQAATAAQTGLNAAMYANPIGLVIAAIAALVVGVILMWKKFEWFRVAMVKIWNYIVDNIQTAIDVVLGIFEFFVNKAIDGVNLLIKAWNLVSWGDDIQEIDKMNFSLDITGAKVDELTVKTKAAGEQFKKAADYAKDLYGVNDKYEKAESRAKSRRDGGGGGGGGGASGGGDSKKMSERSKAIKEMTDSIRKAIMGAFNLVKAFEAMKSSADNLKTAQDKLKEAQEALEYARLTDDATGYASALKDVAAAEAEVTDAQSKQVSFMDALRKQYTEAVKFAAVIEALRKAGLNAAGLQQVISAGAETGIAIGEEILNGGSTAIAESNMMYNALSKMSATIGNETAKEYYNNGKVLGDSIVDGMRSALEGYVVRFSAKTLTAKQMKAIREGTSASVDFPISLVRAVKMAKGGIIEASRGGTLAIIGEAGRDEAVVPLPRNGEMFGGGETNVTINVYGNDPQSVVNALKKYVAVNGRLPVKALS